LVDAVGEELEAGGIAALGVSAIAKRAGVDKALIYKYFGSFEALLERYAEQADLWWSAEEIVRDLRSSPHNIEKKDIFALLLVRLCNALRQRPATLAILAGEVNQDNVLSDYLSVVRERETKRLFGLLARFMEAPPSRRDIIGLTTLMNAITYVALLSRRPGKTVYGAPLGTEDPAWTRFEAAIVSAARSQFAS
jgi:AcrR family transcriptional regulator